MEIKIKNKKTYHGDGIYIGRNYPSSVLKNKFRISSEISREESICLYAEWIKDEIRNNSSIIISELERIFKILVGDQKLNLICHCYPKLCHGNIIRQLLLNKYYHGQWLIDDSIGFSIWKREL